MNKTAIFLLLVALWCGGVVNAQDDPVIMTVNGKPVTRSEFEYSYNKNNNEHVVDRKTVREYVDMFINYKLKVEAAVDARLDTLSSFKKEFASYRDQQVEPLLINDADIEAEAKKIYADYRKRVDSKGGLVKPAHILVMMRQKTSPEQVRKAKVRIDSIYDALLSGADFAELARKCSDDRGSARNGGELPWLESGQTLKEFETQAYALQPGQMSKPFESPAGWHIVKMKARSMCLPYDSLRSNILAFIDRRNIKDALIKNRIDSLASTHTPQITREEVLAKAVEEKTAASPELKFLIQEYYDGLLLFEMSNRMVWDKARNDEAGMELFFTNNKKRYRWTEPRFKGIAFHTRNKADLKAVKKAVKGIPFEQWGEKLKTTFNQDSVLRIRAEKGVFAKGDNPTVDFKVFKSTKTVEPKKDFPFDGVYGKKLKTPDSLADVRSLVLADYQEMLEKQWVDSLRRKYVVTVNEDVVNTVNNH